MKVLVIGSGGREHALCWALRRGAKGKRLRLFCAPGNAGIAEVAECVPLGATDVPALADFAESRHVELTIPGGEAPLAAGLSDEFTRRGLAVAGPTREAARLESSKAFAKEFMRRHGVPTAHHRVASSVREAREILRGGEFGAATGPVVVKADGLAAGKGVVVAHTHAEAESSVVEMMEGGRVGGEAAGRVVIEEALAGREASLLLWTDGRDYRLMPPARDHKRVGENDTGPNTGGMGAVTAPDVLDEETLRRVVLEAVEPTLEGLRADGIDFRGVLFIGLMLTREGPRVLEYNVRFGDPETQAIMLRLRSDLFEIFDAVARGRMGELDVEWSGDASACVVLAARGYPERPETGARIIGLEAASAVPAVQIFHAGTSRGEDGSLRTAGGRVLGVTATGETLDHALARCYESASRIHWEGIHYRRDIGGLR
jgi:phosphoribosylamine--glycine ligase